MEPAKSVSSFEPADVAGSLEIVGQVGGCTLERRTEQTDNCFLEPECSQDCSQQVC